MTNSVSQFFEPTNEREALLANYYLLASVRELVLEVKARVEDQSGRIDKLESKQDQQAGALAATRIYLLVFGALLTTVNVGLSFYKALSGGT
jgi:hypothetical protein